MTLPILRLSRATFSQEIQSTVQSRLEETQHLLIPAITNLKGCMHFWAGIDQAANSMVNLSIWRSLEEARQMDSLDAMRQLAVEFAALGVVFDRPIINYNTL